MGHITHLRKQFKSINTYDFVIMLIKRRKKKHYKLHENLLVLHLKKLESPSPKEALCQVKSKSSSLAKCPIRSLSSTPWRI